MKSPVAVRGPRGLLGAAAVLLALSLFLPLWYTRMEAPQYRGEEALEVLVYAGEVVGDTKELEHLNQYIGVTIDFDLPELHASPWVLRGLLAFCVAGILLPASRTRPAAMVLVGLMVTCTLGGFLLLHRRLYEIGHDRGPSPFARVDDFMPPLLGTRKIANFDVTTGLGSGAWAFAGAFLASIAAARRKHEEEG